MHAARPGAPELSVIVPVRDGAHFLRHSLPALLASDLPREQWELIVVDDGSRDDSVEVAGRYADRVLRQRASAGPPRARNQGAAVARGPILVFVDADVDVHRDALRRIREAFEREPGLSAVFGAYDLAPSAPDLLSQYRNLLHAYVHRLEAGEAVTFWTGLGGIRREAFDEVGRFDERERIDDVELGYRLAGRGRRIRLDPHIQGTHRKRWSLTGVIMTDVGYRGVPWMRLLLQGRHPAGRTSLNVRRQERVLTAAAAVGAVSTVAALVMSQPVWLASLLASVAVILIGDRDFLGWLGGQRGWWFALRSAPLRLLYYGLNVVSVGLALLPMPWRRAAVPAEPSLAKEVQNVSAATSGPELRTAAGHAQRESS
ncbi:MAG TPA: glycosyltransferase family 2 protein [Gemmatimonadales bacterium]|nr:glycosyltransferase family 2 protein [Gemmatimonadales bacterium]